MPSLKSFFEAVNYQVNDGFKYQWDCFGKKAFALDAGNHRYGFYPYWTASVVFDLETKHVRQITFWPNANGDGERKPCRWTHPDYAVKEKREAKKRGFRYEQAYDDVDYEQVKSARTILTRISTAAKKKKRLPL